MVVVAYKLKKYINKETDDTEWTIHSRRILNHDESPSLCQQH